jgi:hypothetical protein
MFRSRAFERRVRRWPAKPRCSPSDVLQEKRPRVAFCRERAYHTDAMFIPKRLYRPLAKIEDASWQRLLEAHPFWQAPGSCLDEEHQDIAFHVLYQDGEIALPSGPVRTSEFEFDSVKVPVTALESPALSQEIHKWANLHANNLGSGQTIKMGWYVVRAGGTLGFHIDGPVFLRGVRADLSEWKIQRAMVETQASRRTVLPLRFNEEDSFMLCSYKAPLRRGELFEFSNVLPHAYFNRGSEHAVLLVTTYLVEDLLPEEFDYSNPPIKVDVR